MSGSWGIGSEEQRKNDRIIFEKALEDNATAKEMSVDLKEMVQHLQIMTGESLK